MQPVINLNEIAPWSDPYEIYTREGLRVVRNGGVPSAEFWDLWRVAKDDLRRAGISVSKFKGQWTLTWWQKPSRSY